MNKHAIGFFYAFLAAITNAINPIFIKWATDVPNETMVFVRFLVSFLFVLPGLFMGKVQFQVKNIGKHAWRAIAGLGGVYCFFYSVKYLPIVDAVTLQNTSPLFMPILVFFAQKLVIPKLEIFALLIGFVGVLLILHPGAELINWACTVAVLGGLFSACGQLGIKELTKVESIHTMMFHYFLISTILSFPPMIFSWKPIENPMLWVWVLAIGIVNLAFQYLKTKALVFAPPTKVSVVTYLAVVISGLTGWWFFDEIPTYLAIGGIALIIAGGLMALFSTQKARKWGS